MQGIGAGGTPGDEWSGGIRGDALRPGSWLPRVGRSRADRGRSTVYRSVVTGRAVRHLPDDRTRGPRPARLARGDGRRAGGTDVHLTSRFAPAGELVLRPCPARPPTSGRVPACGVCGG
ncbi:hypothetical protein GCM10009787_30480 [Streptomyces bangladeshensis]|uniref:Uncharacterized protein n=1 Tax=Streptomyces bangladeshensis TaxID=295352 RepID=A0ABP5N9S0_9ACTN